MTAFEYYQLLVKSATDGTFPSVGVHSLGGGQCCLYRGPGRKKCAAGLLIPDEKYNASLEGRGIPHLCKFGALEIPEGLTDYEVACVQVGHDALAKSGPWDPEKFVTALDKFPCFSGFAERLSHQKKE